MSCERNSAGDSDGEAVLSGEGASGGDGEGDEVDTVVDAGAATVAVAGMIAATAAGATVATGIAVAVATVAAVGALLLLTCFFSCCFFSLLSFASAALRDLSIAVAALRSRLLLAVDIATACNSV